MKIINCNSIAILLATYKAEKYLRDQLDSLLSQTNTDWTCYCQDDGSPDKTVSILSEYSVNYPRHFVVVDHGLTRQGCANNFLTLLNCIESKYYMFCDQDDVWLPDKILLSFDRMKQIEVSHLDNPILIHTDRIFVDETLNVLQASEWNPNTGQKSIIKHETRVI